MTNDHPAPEIRYLRVTRPDGTVMYEQAYNTRGIVPAIAVLPDGRLSIENLPYIIPPWQLSISALAERRNQE